MINGIHFNTPSAPDTAAAQAQHRPQSNRSGSALPQDKVTLSSQPQQTPADADHDGDQK